MTGVYFYCANHCYFGVLHVTSTLSYYKTVLLSRGIGIEYTLNIFPWISDKVIGIKATETKAGKNTEL